MSRMQDDEAVIDEWIKGGKDAFVFYREKVFVTAYGRHGPPCNLLKASRRWTGRLVLCLPLFGSERGILYGCFLWRRK